jgi:hypothetical protein
LLQANAAVVAIEADGATDITLAVLLVLGKLVAGVDLCNLANVFLHPLSPLVLDGVLHLKLVLSNLLAATINTQVLLLVSLKVVQVHLVLRQLVD